jgi:hypothetical protein
MADKNKINAIIPSKTYKLEECDDFFSKLKTHFEELKTAMVQQIPDRSYYKIPMIAGPSGIGKTILLENVDQYTLDNVHISCLVTYLNGFPLTFMELKGTVSPATSVGLRMLYFTFLYRNCNGRVLSQFLDAEYSRDALPTELSGALDVVMKLYGEINQCEVVARRTAASAKFLR